MKKINKIDATHTFKAFALVVALAMFSTTFAQSLQNAPIEQIEINGFDCTELAKLPITQQQRDAICEQMLYGDGFDNVYELLKLEVFSPTEFEHLKPLVKITPRIPKVTPLSRVDALYYKIGDWFDEGVSSDLIDEWVLSIMSRPDLGTMGYNDFVSIQNVSASDAMAILKYRKDGGKVDDRRQLRGILGLSSGGYVAMRDYIGYDRDARVTFSGGYVGARFGSSNGENTFSNVRGWTSYGNYSAGFRFGKKEGDEISGSNWHNPFAYPDKRFYIALSRQRFGDFHIRRAILGDFAATFGEGVTFGTGDYFSSRKTGSGFETRQLGIYPDITSSNTYTLRGFALETRWKFVEPTFFISVSKKAAIMNTDSTDGFSELAANLTGVETEVEEKLFGANLTVAPLTNLRLGTTFYRASYDEQWNPTLNSMIFDTFTFTGAKPKMDNRDAELLGRTQGQDFRSALGVNAVYSLGGFSVAGEYAEIIRDKNITTKVVGNSIVTEEGDATSALFGDDPCGYVLKTEWITNRFSTLALYRHYDVDFDNPYSRGFSEYQRYKGSILEKDYRLVDTSFIALAEENPRPQAEDGVYFRLFGRATNTISGTLEMDAWKRLTDNADYRRIVLKGSYRPNSVMSFRIWRKWQGRSEENSLVPTSYDIDEIRLTAEARTSDWSTVGFTIVHSLMTNPPMPSYVAPADPFGGDALIGSTEDISEGLMLGSKIFATQKLAFETQAIIYRGWLWNFENSDFSVLESKTDALRWWLAASDRIGKNMSLTFKFSFDKPLAITNLDTRGFTAEGVVEGTNIRESKTSWDIKFDYFF